MEILSEVVGQKITHKRISSAGAKEFYMSFGLPEDYALMLMGMTDRIASGEEEAYFRKDVKIVGKSHLRDFFQANRHVWIPE